MKTATLPNILRRHLDVSHRWLLMGCLLAISLALTASSALAGGYAAIAVGSTGGYGWSHNKETRAEAEAKALQECEDAGGSNPKVVMWAHEGVIALAIGDKKGAYGTGRDNRRKAAQDQAVDNCDKHTENSHVVVTIDTEE